MKNSVNNLEDEEKRNLTRENNKQIFLKKTFIIDWDKTKQKIANKINKWREKL